ncbi:hypothetical protein [Clostridium hydrogenum]|nr:hypothetical protein [Clostridium hydrogenum]
MDKQEIENFEMEGFEIECLEEVEAADWGDNAMYFAEGFATGISVVVAFT